MTGNSCQAVGSGFLDGSGGAGGSFRRLRDGRSALGPAEGAQAEIQGKPGADGPADGPGQPDAGGAQHRGRQRHRQSHPQDQVGKGGNHELHHQRAAAQHAVRHQLEGHHKVEGGHDPQKEDAGLDGGAGGLVHEQEQQLPPGEEVGRRQGHADQPHQFDAGDVALAHPLGLGCAQVLAGVVGDAVGQGGERGDDQVVQLDRRRIAGDDAGAKAVDDALDDDVAHRHRALLQDAGHGDDRDLAQHLPGKEDGLFRGGDAFHPAGHRQQGQHAADALAQEGGPGHARHPHVKGGDEQNVHKDVAHRRGRQEKEGGAAVAQRRENAGGYVVKEHEGQAQDVDVQVQGRVGQDLGRGVDELKQGVAPQKAHQHQGGHQHRAPDQGGGDGGLHVAVLLGPEKPGHDDRTADVAPKGEGDEDQSDLIAVAHGRQGRFADEFAGHQAVRNVVQLLKDHAAEHGQAELPQHGGRISHRQILVHKNSSLQAQERKPLL